MRAIRNIARIRLPIATLITMAGNNHGTDLIVEVGNAKSNGLPVLETLLLPQRTCRLLPREVTHCTRSLAWVIQNSTLCLTLYVLFELRTIIGATMKMREEHLNNNP